MGEKVNKLRPLEKQFKKNNMHRKIMKNEMQKVLKERPDGIVGISVPGMPVGSPGMEGSYKEDYPVVVFDSNGRIHLY